MSDNTPDIPSGIEVSVHITGWQQIGAQLADLDSEDQADLFNGLAFGLGQLDDNSRNVQLAYIAEELEATTGGRALILDLAELLKEVSAT